MRRRAAWANSCGVPHRQAFDEVAYLHELLEMVGLQNPPGSLPLAQTRGGLLGGRGGRVREYRHPAASTPGGFPLDTCRREA